MKKNILLTSLASLAMSQTLHAMVVSEWGTFTSLQGSNGIDQIGVYQDDEKLPDFVHGLGQVLPSAKPPATPSIPFPDNDCEFKNVPCRVLRANRITQRMETPVIYFYHDQPTEQPVTVDVGFPKGVISETFPAPLEAFPGPNATELTNGKVRFQVSVLPKGSPAESLIPFVDAQNIYSHARIVDSNVIRAQREAGAKAEHEKFIFYRGVGKFEGSLQVSNTGPEPFIKNINPATDQKIKEIFLIHTDSLGRSAFEKLPGLESQNGYFKPNGFFESFSQRPRITIGYLKKELQVALIRSGLSSDEATAMVDTWENGYFKTPGLRILYVLAPETVERILPMKVNPQPEKLTRVMVGRLEILTATQESDIAFAILEQGEKFQIQTLGRFAEAKLRAVQDFTKNIGRFPPELQKTLDVLIERAGNQTN